MRRLALLALLTLSAGGCDSGSTDPDDDVALRFRIDGQTCTGTGTLRFFVDGVLVGSETLTAGGTSQVYTTTRGTHVLGANEVGGYTWPPMSVDLSASYTHILTC